MPKNFLMMMFDGMQAREGRGLVMTPRGEREDERSAGRGASGEGRQVVERGRGRDESKGQRRGQSSHDDEYKTNRFIEERREGGWRKRWLMERG